MGIKFVSSDTIKRDVVIQLPDNSELIIKQVEFKYLDKEGYLAHMNEKGDEGIIDLIVGWDEFLDADGNNVKPTAAYKKQLVDYGPAQQALNVFYGRAIMGVDSKNFAASQSLGFILRAQLEKGQTRKPKRKKSKSKRSSKSKA